MVVVVLAPQVMDIGGGDQRATDLAGDPDDLAMAVGALAPDEVLVDEAGPAGLLRWRSDAIDDTFPFTLDEAGTYRVEALPGPRTVSLGAIEAEAMKASKGKANPAEASELLRKLLGS